MIQWFWKMRGGGILVSLEATGNRPVCNNRQNNHQDHQLDDSEDIRRIINHVLECFDAEIRLNDQLDIPDQRGAPISGSCSF